MYDVIAVGSGTVDVFIDTGLHELRRGRRRFIAYPVGSKLMVEDARIFTGGGGTNSAVSFSRLGLRTAYLGKVGRDEFASRILDELKREKVSFIGVQADGMTNFSAILDSKERNRTILAYKSVSDTLRFKELKKGRLRTRWFYFSSMTEESFRTQKRLAGIKGVKVAYNPSGYLTERGAKYLSPMLRHVDVLVLNREEARMLVRRGDLLDGLRRLGPKIVCVTDGMRGVYASDGIFDYSLEPHDVKARERTGAGDAFASGFVGGIIRGNDMATSLQIGLANSESVIRRMGAKNNLLGWKEVMAAVRKRPGRLRSRRCRA